MPDCDQCGVYSSSDAGRAMEHQNGYLQTVFDFFGITDARFVRAEGLAMGDAKKAEVLVEAAAQAQHAIGSAAKRAQVAVAA